MTGFHDCVNVVKEFPIQDSVLDDGYHAALRGRIVLAVFFAVAVQAAIKANVNGTGVFVDVENIQTAAETAFNILGLAKRHFGNGNAFFIQVDHGVPPDIEVFLTLCYRLQ